MFKLWSKLGAFAGGILFGTAGIAILKSEDAKNVYTHCTAAVKRDPAGAFQRECPVGLQQYCALPAVAADIFTVFSLVIVHLHHLLPPNFLLFADFSMHHVQSDHSSICCAISGKSIMHFSSHILTGTASENV